ncbi:MAG: TMEM43 family protein [Akkermansia sp.]|nr:TMEM43 family protein [Akkermansia sp.]
MAYTETTTQSWGSRLGDSIKGIIIGFILFIGSFPLLFWNEGNSVKVARALEEGRGITVEVQDISRIDPANEGKLVHMCGDATTQDVLKDAEFGISHNGMMLRRMVQYYQWVEKSHKETKKNFGGSETTVTTYTYEKKWCCKPQDSSAFKEVGHTNSVFYSTSGTRQYAENVKYGAFRFSPDMIEKLGNERTYSLTEYKVPDKLRGRACVADKYLYIGRPVPQAASAPTAAAGFGQQGAQAAREVAANAQQPAALDVERTKLEMEQLRLQVKQQELVQQDPAATAEQKQAAKLAAARAEIEIQQKELLLKQAELAAQSAAPQDACSVDPANPQIGDVRVTWEVISPKEPVSIVYVQTRDTFTPYHAKSDRSVALLGMGTQTAEQLYEHAEDMNTITTWILRFVGWFLMFIGLSMIFKPLSVLGDVVPFIGTLIGGASSIVAAVLALILSITTIAIAWIWYRPMLGIALLVLAALLVAWLIKGNGKKGETPAETV